MFSKNKINILLLLVNLTIVKFSHSQIQIGGTYGYNYNLSDTEIKKYKSISNIELNLKYKIKSTLQPTVSMQFTEIPLKYSAKIINNQGNAKTIVTNNTIDINLGIEKKIINNEIFRMFSMFNIGTSFLRNPLVILATTNESFGYYSNYNLNKNEKNFAFLDLNFRIEKNLSKSWILNLDLGSKYYPKETEVSVQTKIDFKDIEINSSFSKIRPYYKLGINYLFKSK